MKHILHKAVIALFLCFVYNTSSAQLVLNDSTGCNGVTYLSALLSGTNQNSNVTSDDVWSDVIDIGFTFNFYGTNYTQCLIGGNGLIGFDLTQAGQGQNWDLQNNAGTGPGPGIPGNTNCLNSISGVYSDIYPPGGGTLTYATTGTAPNRIFVVTWCSVPMYIQGTCNNDPISFQILLYETSNNIEVQTAHKQTCAAWNGGLAIQGVQNAAGTIGTTATGRNNTVWTAYNDGTRFTPTSPTNTANYTYSAIPYNPIPTVNSTVYWYLGTTLIGTGQNIQVSPTVTTTYTAEAIGCSDTSITTITITPQIGGGGAPVIDSFHFTNPSACGYCDGTATLYGLRPNLPDSVFYTFNGVPQPAIVTTTVGPDSLIILNNLCAGAYTDVYVKVGACISNPVSFTLTTPPVIAQFTPTIHLGCNGDTVVFTNGSSPVGPQYHYYWTFGDGSAIDSTDFSPTYIYHTQGVFTEILVVSDGICTDTFKQTITLYHPLDASFTVSADTICLGQTITFANHSTGIGPNNTYPAYLWNYGDGSPLDTAVNPSHTYNQPGSFNVNLTVTDFRPCSLDTTIPVRVETFSIRTDFKDTVVCLVDSMLLKSYITSPYDLNNFSFEWMPSNVVGDPGAQDPNFLAYGDYTMTVTATSIPFGCVASDTEHIHSHPKLNLTNLTAGQTIPYGDSIQLNAEGADYYFWTPDNGTLNNPNINDPVATPTQPTVYTVYGISIYGCRDTATVNIGIDFTMSEFIPSAFSPNGDGRNDVFRILNMKYQKLLDFRVYDRWGKLVFQTADVNKGWDGTYGGAPQEIGAYNYIIIVARPDGTEKTYTGTVTLVR